MRVRGSLRDGRTLNEPAVVNQMSSHGIRISIQTALPNGSEVDVQVAEDRPTTRYRVVWAVEGDTPGSWQMGLELVESSGTPRGPAAPEAGTGTGTVYE